MELVCISKYAHLFGYDLHSLCRAYPVLWPNFLSDLTTKELETLQPTLRVVDAAYDMSPMRLGYHSTVSAPVSGKEVRINCN